MKKTPTRRRIPDYFERIFTTHFPYCRATERRVSCAGARLLLTDFFFLYARTYYNKLNTRVPWPLRARRLYFVGRLGRKFVKRTTGCRRRSGDLISGVIFKTVRNSIRNEPKDAYRSVRYFQWVVFFGRPRYRCCVSMTIVNRFCSRAKFLRFHRSVLVKLALNAQNRRR